MLEQFGDLNAVRIFVRVVDAKSFSAAATALGLPKSTVSRKISELEARLGVRLLHRTTRKLSVTAAGASYYARSSRIIADLDEAETAISDMQRSLTGTLKITAPVELGMQYLGPMLADFLAAHRGIRIDLELGDRIVDLVEEGFDLAIRAGTPEPSTLVVKTLGGARLQAYASPAYLAARGTPEVPEDLRRHDCLVFTTWPWGRVWRFGVGAAVVDVPVRGPLTANNISVVRAAAEAGLGVALLPAFFGEPSVQEGALVPVLEAHETPSTSLYVAYPSSRHMSARIRALVDFLAERFGH